MHDTPMLAGDALRQRRRDDGVTAFGDRGAQALGRRQGPLGAEPFEPAALGVVGAAAEPVARDCALVVALDPEGRVGQQRRELVAAVAADDVDVGAQRVGQDAGDGHQGRVAGLVAVGVVELLEVVDIEHEQRERGVVAAEAGHLFAQAVAQVAVVGRGGRPSVSAWSCTAW